MLKQWLNAHLTMFLVVTMSNEYETDMFGILITNITEIQKRSEKRHDELLRMFAELNKTIEDVLCNESRKQPN